ncbi:MAG: Gfo/Idh/MocA family oxidoreductase [Bacteroidia bacterium]|nr:Gfo/Idh/MocA family oxidoreductase [Bacteroidia bacterium]
MSEKVLKVVCVGAGYFADFHLEAWKRMPGVELVAICDLDAQKSAAFAQKYQIPNNYTDYREMIQKEKADLIDVITPPASHLEICTYAASQGLHIICQKPLAPTYQEAIELVETVQSYDVRFMVHENFRFQPWFRLMKEKLDQGVLGDRLHQINFRFRTGDGWQEDAYMNRQPYFRQMPRLLMFETGVHYIDTFRFLGGEISAVYAQLDRWNSNIAGEDAGLIMFEFEQGGRAIWDANRYNESQAEDPRFTFGTCWLEGNKGALHLGTDGKIAHHPLGENSTEIPYKLEKKNFSGDCVYATQKHFIDALHANKAFETSGQDYLKTLRILEAVYESAKRKQRIEISAFSS